MTGASIDPTHYDFARCVDIKRGSSCWHQVNERLALRPRSVLEIGVGSGLYKSTLKALHCPATSVDVNPALEPEHVGGVTALPFGDASHSIVVAWQVLEHLSYENFRLGSGAVRRAAAEHVVSRFRMHASSGARWSTSARASAAALMSKPGWRARMHRVTGDHPREISKVGYPVSRILSDLASRGLSVLRHFEVPQNPYHHFFVCRTLSVAA